MAIRHTSASVVVATRTLHTSRAVCMASGPHVFEATDADFEQKVVKVCGALGYRIECCMYALERLQKQFTHCFKLW